jgi:hypothetical protein
VLRAADLHVVRTYDHDPFEPVLWAAFEPQGDAVRMVTRTSDPRFGGDELLRWHPDTDTLDPPTPLPRTQPLGVLAAPAGTLVAGQERDLWWPRGRGAPLVLARHNGSEPLALAAASPDGRLLARAFRREVQLYDTATGAIVGLPLATNAQALDAIVDLGFADGGRQLRARTVLGANVVWPLPVERRPLAQLTDALARVDLDRESQTVVRMPGARERAALRAADPGLPKAAPPAPPLVGTGRAVDGSIVPPRSPSTPPTAIALDHEYTNGPEDVRNTFYSVLPMLRPYPAGLQRIGGVDFDLRGLVQIGSSVEFGARPDKAMRARMALRATTYGLRCLPLPAGAIAAVDLLLRPSLRTPLPTGKPLMTLTLHYADGGTVTLPLRAGVELPGYSGDDAAVREVFATEVGTVVYGFESERISAPRVPNPEPARVVRCLDLDTLHVDTPVALLGITVEPVAGPAPAAP